MIQKGRHLITFEAVRSKLQATIDEINASEYPRPILTDKMLEPYSENVIEVMSVQTKPYTENDQQQLIDLAAYHKFLGHQKFKDIIRENYSSGRIPKIGDIVIYTPNDKYYVGFVNMIRETTESTGKKSKTKDYVTVVISYLEENGTVYTESSIHKVSNKDVINRLLIDEDMLFGRPYEECMIELETESRIVQEENKRRSKKKIMTVGEYEDMMKMLEKLIKTVNRLDDKIPYHLRF